jgi:hypothetical protein
MHIQEALMVLEMPLNSFEVPRNVHPNIAVKKLEEFKDLVKSQRKKLVKKYHPDVSPNSEDKMKLINNTVDELMKIQIRVRQPRPIMRQHIIIRHFGGGFGSTASDSTTSTSFYSSVNYG